MSDWKIPARSAALILAGRIVENEATGVLLHAQGIVVLSGDPGCGKTVAAARWCGEGGAFLSAAKLARVQRYDNETMDRLLAAGRLVIDDMGTEYLDEKGNFLSVLDEVANDRYANMRPTVITTNLTAGAFLERYGGRLADRIREVGRFVVLASSTLRIKPIDDELLAAEAETGRLVLERENKLADERDQRRIRDERDEFFRKREEQARKPPSPGTLGVVLSLADSKSVPQETEDQIRERENNARNKAAQQVAEWQARNGATAP